MAKGVTNDPTHHRVELVQVYSNLFRGEAGLGDVATSASKRRASRGAERPRQRQRRLSPAEVMQLVAAYRGQGTPMTKLARSFGVHRTTVAAILQRSEL